MFVVKAVQCKIIGLTEKKKELLDKEYDNFNNLAKFISEANQNGIDEVTKYKFLKDKVKLYSLAIANAIMYCKKSKKEQPLILANQSIKVIKLEKKLSNYWLKIPIYKLRGGIYVPLQFGKQYEELFETGDLRGSEIIKRNGEYYAHLSFRKEVKPVESYSSILAIDLGEKVMATAVLSGQMKPIFYGKEIRGIRRHYAYLRKRLGNKKLLKVIKRIGSKERNKINSILHEITKDIVKLATNTNSIIVVGDLKGIRKSAQKKGRRMRRLVGAFTFYKFVNYLTYKANWNGIEVVKINEEYTSRTCSECDYCDKKNRKIQGLFKCLECNYQVNADFNAAKNILNRGLEYISKSGDLAYSLKSALSIQA